jgi:hypothetical protein
MVLADSQDTITMSQRNSNIVVAGQAGGDKHEDKHAERRERLAARDDQELPKGCRLHSISARQSAGATKLARAANLSFHLGKAGSKGVLFNHASYLYASLYKMGTNGNSSILYRLDYEDPRASHPAVEELLSEYRLQPMVTLGRTMDGLVMPISPVFDGAVELLDMVQRPDVKGLWYKWESTADGSLGAYNPHIIPMTDEKAELWDAIRWPSAKEILASVPVIQFDTLLEEDPRFSAVA